MSGGKPPLFNADLKSVTSFGSAMTCQLQPGPEMLLLIRSDDGRGAIVPQRILAAGCGSRVLLWEPALAPEEALLPEAADWRKPGREAA